MEWCCINLLLCTHMECLNNITGTSVFLAEWRSKKNLANFFLSENLEVNFFSRVNFGQPSTSNIALPHSSDPMLTKRFAVDLGDFWFHFQIPPFVVPKYMDPGDSEKKWPSILIKSLKKKKKDACKVFTGISPPLSSILCLSLNG